MEERKPISKESSMIITLAVIVPTAVTIVGIIAILYLESKFGVICR